MRKQALFSCLLASLVLSGCGADDTVVAAACADLDGAVYHSATLEESGPTPDGIHLGHWRVSFSLGEVQMMQSDFGLAGTYECSAEGVVLTVFDETQVLDFSKDFSTLRFNPLEGDALTYVRAKESPADDFIACENVRGKTYRTPIDSAASDDAPTELVAAPEVYVSFADSQSAELNLGDGGIVSGIYECSMGELHVHADEKDKTPLVLVASADGSSVSFTYEERKYELFSEAGGGVCTEIYQPVCGIENRDIQCVTTPCHNQFYKTYGNACHARNANSPIISEGECGDQEGQPVGKACTREYNPVCGAQNATRPCLSAPCPKLEHKTFGNPCEANAAGAMTLFPGECGDKEGEEIDNLGEYIACPALWDPVCAKALGDVQCITTPCPTHEYRTFGNACSAMQSRAGLIISGECPKALTEVPVTAEPPVVLVNSFPTPAEQTTIVKAGIKNDVLTVTLGYSGCSEQHYSLLVQDAFLKSEPVQVNYQFQPVVEDFCDAYFETEFTYDLMPLRLAYSQSYKGAGVIAIPEIGRYEFDTVELPAQ